MATSFKISLTVVLFATLYLVVNEAGEDRIANENGKEVKKLVKSFCAKFGLKYIIMGDDNENKEYDSCKATIQKYFVRRSENDEAIKTYTQFCKDNGIDATKCAEVMVYMNSQKFDMENVMDILKFIDVDSYIKLSDKVKSFFIYQREWRFLRELPGFEINKCMDDLLKTENKFVSSHQKMTRSFVYRSWLEAREEESACSCVEVFGIFKLFDWQYGAPLEDIFNELCLGNYFTIRKVWTKTHYEAIVSERKKIELSEGFTFLKLAEPIAEAGWQSGFQDPDWTFLQIEEACKLEKTYDSSVTPDFRKECLNLIALAIRFGFKKADFDIYLQITDKVNDDFKRTQCKHDIVKTIFDLTVADLKQVYKNIKNDHLPYPEKMKKFLISFDKVIINQQMEAILDVYKIDKGTDNSCSRFTLAIKDIKVMFYHDKNDPFMNYLIGAKTRGVSFDEAINQIKNLLENKGDDKK